MFIFFVWSVMFFLSGVSFFWIVVLGFVGLVGIVGVYFYFFYVYSWID